MKYEEHLAFIFIILVCALISLNIWIWQNVAHWVFALIVVVEAGILGRARVSK